MSMGPLMGAMVKVAALSVVASAFEFALPSGKLRKTGARAMSIIVLLSAAECVARALEGI